MPKGRKGRLSITTTSNNFLKELFGLEDHNACLIVAIGQLLNNLDWATIDLVEKIIQHDGYPNEELKKLEQYAPVRVWDEPVTFQGNGSLITIPNRDGSDCASVLPDEKIVVAYATTPGRAHMACITAKQLFEFEEKLIIAVITKSRTQV